MPDERRTQAERREQTERRVLEATLRLISRQGSRATSLAQVGAEAGYSRGIVTHQFGSRDQLLDRAARYAQAAIEAPTTDARGLQRLLVTVRAYLDELGRLATTTQAFLQMWAEAVTSEPALRQVFIERDEHFRELLAALVAEGITLGSVRPDTDSAAVAGLLVCQLRGAGLQLMLTEDTAAYAAAGAALLELLERGLAVESPGPNAAAVLPKHQDPDTSTAGKGHQVRGRDQVTPARPNDRDLLQRPSALPPLD